MTISLGKSYNLSSIEVKAECPCCSTEMKVPVREAVLNDVDRKYYKVCSDCQLLTEVGYVHAIVVNLPNSMQGESITLDTAPLTGVSYYLSREYAVELFGELILYEDYFLVTKDMAAVLAEQALSIEEAILD